MRDSGRARITTHAAGFSLAWWPAPDHWAEAAPAAELAARHVEYDDVDDTYCRLHDDVWLVKVACGPWTARRLLSTALLRPRDARALDAEVNDTRI